MGHCSRLNGGIHNPPPCLSSSAETPIEYSLHTWSMETKRHWRCASNNKERSPWWVSLLVLSSKQLSRVAVIVLHARFNSFATLKRAQRRLFAKDRLLLTSRKGRKKQFKIISTHTRPRGRFACACFLRAEIKGSLRRCNCLHGGLWFF